MITRTYLIYDYDEKIWESEIVHEPMMLEDRVVKYSEASLENTSTIH